MRTTPIFQKFEKIFCYLLVSGITNLHVKYIPDIKKRYSFVDVRMIRLYSIR